MKVLPFSRKHIGLKLINFNLIAIRIAQSQKLISSYQLYSTPNPKYLFTISLK